MKPRKPKKCRGCGDKFTPERSFQVVCNAACSYTYIQNKKRTEKEKKISDSKKANRKALVDLNRRDVRWQHKQTQKVFNKMRVLQELLWFKERGEEPVCISCGKPLGGDQWCCGHFKTVGAQGALRYDPTNTYLQHNRNCNMGLSGDIYGTKNTRGYVDGLKIRFGEEEGQRIIDHCETNQTTTKWEWSQLEEMRVEFNKEIRRVEKLL
jgi:hypothetical protein